MNTLGTFINVSILEYDKSFKSNVPGFNKRWIERC